MKNPRVVIDSLLTEGKQIVWIILERQSRGDLNLHNEKMLRRRAQAYLDAAHGVLHGFPELHNELIDLEGFAYLRNFFRSHLQLVKG